MTDPDADDRARWTFERRGLAPGRYRALASCPDGEVCSEPVELRAGEVATLRLDFPRTRGLGLRLVDPTGRPLARTAGLLRARGAEDQPFETDDDGLARLGVPRDAGRFELLCEGFAPCALELAGGSDGL